MSLEHIKEYIKSNVGKSLSFRINGSRNQIEEFEGVIVETYNRVFLVKEVNTRSIKSFSYNDVLIKNLVIKGV